jgi:hypothetical protein
MWGPSLLTAFKQLVHIAGRGVLYHVIWAAPRLGDKGVQGVCPFPYMVVPCIPMMSAIYKEPSTAEC